MSVKLEKEFKFFRSHKKSLGEKYRGKYVVIKNGKVVGAYDSDLEAVLASQKRYKLGSFLVQYFDPDQAECKQTFHSRVVFK